MSLDTNLASRSLLALQYDTGMIIQMDGLSIYDTYKHQEEFKKLKILEIMTDIEDGDVYINLSYTPHNPEYVPR